MVCGRLWSIDTVFRYAGPPPGTGLGSRTNLADGVVLSFANNITSAADRRRLGEYPAPRRKRMARGTCAAAEMLLTVASNCGENSYEFSCKTCVRNYGVNTQTARGGHCCGHYLVEQ